MNFCFPSCQYRPLPSRFNSLLALTSGLMHWNCLQCSCSLSSPANAAPSSCLRTRPWLAARCPRARPVRNRDPGLGTFNTAALHFRAGPRPTSQSHSPRSRRRPTSVHELKLGGARMGRHGARKLGRPRAWPRPGRSRFLSHVWLWGTLEATWL